jgi:hypothetical protein
MLVTKCNVFSWRKNRTFRRFYKRPSSSSLALNQWTQLREYWYGYGARTSAVPQIRRLVAGFPQRLPGLEPRSVHVGFVADKVELGQVFSGYFGFPCEFSFHRLLHTHHLSSGAGTTGQTVADMPSGLSPRPKKNNVYYSVRATFSHVTIIRLKRDYLVKYSSNS